LIKPSSRQEAEVVLWTIATNTSRNIRRTILQETLQSRFAIGIDITIAFTLSTWITCCANANLGV
jgi:hypothetical protein